MVCSRLSFCEYHTESLSTQFTALLKETIQWWTKAYKRAGNDAGVEKIFLIPDEILSLTGLHGTNATLKRRESLRRSRSILRMSSAKCLEEGFDIIETSVTK